MGVGDKIAMRDIGGNPGIIQRFNTACGIGAPVWHQGSFPNTAVMDPSLPGSLGSPAQAAFTQGDYDFLAGAGTSDVGKMAASVMFNVLHNWAQQLTRVRIARLVFFSTVGSVPTTQAGAALCALKPELALSFPFPVAAVGSALPSPGDYALAAGGIDGFLTALSAKLSIMRNPASAAPYQHTFFACHSSCHSSCHGARGRR